MTDLLYSDDETALRESVRSLIATSSDATAITDRMESPEPYDARLWQRLVEEIGVTSLPIPESLGGTGASWRETAVVAEELGRSVVGTPFLTSVLATAVALSLESELLVQEVLQGNVAVGVPVTAATVEEATLATATDRGLSGTIPHVCDLALAGKVVVPARHDGELTLHLVDKSDLVVRPTVSLDQTRPLAELILAETPGRLLAAGQEAENTIASMLLSGAAVLASEQLGLAERCLEMSVEYLKTRHQFGRPIGGYQALKHRAADVWTTTSIARAAARYAADCLARGDSDLPVAASVAQAYVGRVAVRAAEECLQFHGGLGFTWEYPTHLLLKRAKGDAVALGTAAIHYRKLSGLVDLPVPTA